MEAIRGNTLLKTLNKVGNFLIHEQWRDRNFCRADAEVALDLAGGEPLEVGEVVYRLIADGPAAEFIRPVTTVALADPTLIEVGIVVDERVQDPTFFVHPVSDGFGTDPASGLGVKQIDWSAAVAQTTTLAILKSGDAIVRDGGLTFGTYVLDGTVPADDTSKETLIAALETQQRIVVQDSLKGKYSTDNVHDFRNASNQKLPTP